MMIALDRDQLALAAEHARLCKHAYVSDRGAPPEGWTRVATVQDILPNSSGLDGAIYQRTCGGDMDARAPFTVVFTGCNGLTDLRSAFNVFTKRLPPQFNDAVAFIDRACDVLNITPQDIDLVGHSLGGYLARLLTRVMEVGRVWCFSSPGPDDRVVAELAALQPTRLPGHDQIIHVRARDDIIARFGPGEKQTIILEPASHPHDIATLGNMLGEIAGLAALPGEALHLQTPARDIGNAMISTIGHMLGGSRHLKALIGRLSAHKRPETPPPASPGHKKTG